MGVYYTLYNETRNHVVKGYWKGCPPTIPEVDIIARHLGWNLDRDRIVANSDSLYSYVMKKVKLPRHIEYLNCFTSVANCRWELYSDDYGDKVDDDSEDAEYYSFTDNEIKSIERTKCSFVL